ncbi:lebercilin-like protein isoform X2 [Paralichthys olivaceus]|uniref:lebercilin-like protein isoform X2 n=1 Tax=Paralichthys olivaceus TaxID=8255 RepID=UPI00375170B2
MEQRSRTLSCLPILFLMEKHNKAMDVKRQNLRTFQRSKLSGKGKDTKTRRTFQNQGLKVLRNKPRQVSNQKTHSEEVLRIRELKNRGLDELQQLRELKNDNRLLKTLVSQNKVILQQFPSPDNRIFKTLTKYVNKLYGLQTLSRQTRACSNNTTAKLNAVEDKLLNANDSLQHLKRLSQDHNLLKKEPLICMMAQVLAKLEQKDTRIKELERHIQLSQIWFNHQLAKGKWKFNITMKCTCPKPQNLTQDMQDEASELQTAQIASESKDIQTDGSTEASSPVQSDTYEIVQLDEQLEEDQEDEQLEEHLEDQEDEQLEEQLDEQEDEEKQESPVNLYCCDPVQESLDTETEDSSNVLSAESHVEDPAVEEERSLLPVATEAPLVFQEKQKPQKHEESLKLLTKAKQNYTFKQTINNLHKGLPAYRCEYVKDPKKSPAVRKWTFKPHPEQTSSGKPTQDGACSSLNLGLTNKPKDID